ncbi:hypothetical protein QWZ06_26050 [Chryseobacterium tructae]|uniref:Gliding motility-associated protein GldM C-terminal domain-containing protein n=1 Tax=Chryseobacterium tructae TaxID=1037380 RepID=A0ABV7XSS2_9FLAO|nr:hypothetical protein [Chryseobacterium tructae]MDN3695441.1 hypothetical protein [Chryseobacterium tructae]
MKFILFHYRWYMICFLFFGSIQSFAQIVNKGDSQIQCTQKLKLISDRMIFTKNRQEKPIEAAIFLDPANSTIKTILKEPDQKQPSEQTYLIKNMNCTVNDNFTSGRIIYTVTSDNPDGSLYTGEFLLEATRRGTFFSNTLDSPDNKAVIPIVKFEKL